MLETLGCLTVSNQIQGGFVNHLIRCGYGMLQDATGQQIVDSNWDMFYKALQGPGLSPSHLLVKFQRVSAVGDSWCLGKILHALMSSG